MYEGECENDSSASSHANGQGTMRYASGDVYVGGWLRGKREAHGVLTSARVKPGTEYRNTYTGMWAEDNKQGARLQSLR